MNLRLSIIIPVYNTERWIARCLDSCLDQDIPHSDYEIIVVNDGTPDNAMHIVSRYAAKYDSIKVVEQSNAGLSAARNTGLSHASGAYVWFVDSDDYIECNCLSTILDTAYEGNLDVLCFDERMVWDDGRVDRIPLVVEKYSYVYNGRDFIRNNDMPKPAWMAIYGRRFLLNNNLFFYNGILHEDQEFTPRAYCLADRIAFIDMIVYNYVQRDNSIMTAIDCYNKKKAHDLLVVADSLYKFSCDYLRLGSIEYDKMINNVNFAFCQSLRNYSSEFFPMSIYQEKPYYPLAINKFQTRKEKVKHIIINISIKAYLWLYDLLAK